MPLFTDAALRDAPRFAQAAVGGLPVPIYALQVIALGQENGPENIEDAFVFPAGEGAVDAAVVAELFGEVVPLTACLHSVDDAVEGLALAAALAACLGRRVIDGQYLLDHRPERVGGVPDGWQGLLFCLWFSGLGFQFSFRVS